MADVFILCFLELRLVAFVLDGVLVLIQHFHRLIEGGSELGTLGIKSLADFFLCLR